MTLMAALRSKVMDFEIKKSPLIIKGYIFPTGSDIFMIPGLKIP